LVVAPDREELHWRIGARLDAMMAHGGLDEVAQLAASHFNPALPIMNALGVRPLIQHLRGQTSLEEATAQTKAETRQYAKRQLTWAQRHMIAWKWIFTKETESLLRSSMAFIDT